MAAGIHSVLVQHLQVLPVEQHAATIARVRNLKTRGEAVAYLNEATQLLRSLEDTTRPPPPPPTSQLIFSATTLNFGRVPVGDVQAETLFIRNSTGRPVQIQAPECRHFFLGQFRGHAFEQHATRGHRRVHAALAGKCKRRTHHHQRQRGKPSPNIAARLRAEWGVPAIIPLRHTCFRRKSTRMC